MNPAAEVALTYIGGFVARYASDAPITLEFSSCGNDVTVHMDGHPYPHRRELLKCMASGGDVRLADTLH